MLRYSSFKMLTNLGSQALQAGNSPTKKVNDWFTLYRCFHDFHEVKNKQDSKRMQRNIFQHKQQNAVLKECWLMSMPMSLQRSSLGERRTCTWRNRYCAYAAYIVVTGISNNTKVRFKGSSRER